MAKRDYCLACGQHIEQSPGKGRPRLYCPACKEKKSRRQLPLAPEQPAPPQLPEL
jgi:hypothetical protein